MPASSSPSLEKLQDALIHGNLEQLHLLRKELDWSPKSDKLVTSPLSQDGDCGLDRLHLMLDNYGPKCLECKNADFCTLVHLTAKTCDSVAAMELIYKTLGEDKNALDCFLAKEMKSHRTAVHCAAENNNNAALKWLAQKLGKECLQLQTLNKTQAVHFAAQFQCSDSLAFINAELGAAVFKKRNMAKQTPFHLAASNERGCDSLKWLIKEVGSELLTAKDYLDNTPVHLAARHQDRASMELLKETLGIKMFTLKGDDGQSVVHCAAKNQITNSALAWCIKEMGADCLKARDSKNRTPVHLAAQYQSDGALQMAVDALGEECLTTLDESKQTVVHYAAMNKRCNSALRWLVQKLGPDCLKTKDANDRMPIHLAGSHQGVDSMCFIRLCLGNAAFQLPGCAKRTVARYAAENKANKKAELLNWIVKEIGPQCMLVPDVKA